MIFAFFTSLQGPPTSKQKWSQKRRQKPPKIDPKRSPSASWNACVVLKPAQTRFFTILASNMASTWAPKSLKKRSNIDLAAQRPPRSLKEHILTPNSPDFGPFWPPTSPQHLLTLTLSRLSGRLSGRSPTGDPATEPGVTRTLDHPFHIKIR